MALTGVESTYRQSLDVTGGESLVEEDIICKDAKFYLLPEGTQRSATDLDTGMAMPAMMLLLEEVVVPAAVLLFGQNECTSEVKQCSSKDGTCPDGEEPAWEEPGVSGDVIPPGDIPNAPVPDDGDHL